MLSYVESAVSQVNHRVRRIEIHRWEDLPVLERQDCLNQSSDTRRRIEMSNVTLHGAKGISASSGLVALKNTGQSGNLNWITKSCTGPMRLHVPDGLGLNCCPHQCLSDHPRLTLHAWR